MVLDCTIENAYDPATSLPEIVMRVETYASATTASNLAQSDARRVPVDVLTAAGLCGRRAKLAHALLRCRTVGQPGDRADARQAMTQALLNVKRKRPATWPGMDVDMAMRIAHAVLTYWGSSASTCSTCQGRGYQPVPGTPTLSPRACPACGGTGRVDLQEAIRAALGPKAVDPARWLYGEIDAIEAAFLRRMGGALR
jgi:hypothetical protein